MSKWEKFRGVIAGDRGQASNFQFGSEMPANYTVREQKMCEGCGRVFYRDRGSEQEFCTDICKRRRFSR